MSEDSNIPEEAEEEEYEQFLDITESFENGDPKVLQYSKELSDKANEFVQAMASEDGPDQRQSDTQYSSEYDSWRTIRFFEPEDGEDAEPQAVNF